MARLILKGKEKHSSRNKAPFQTKVSEDPSAVEGEGIEQGEVPKLTMILGKKKIAYIYTDAS
jgi:hypothetical protein